MPAAEHIARSEQALQASAGTLACSSGRTAPPAHTPALSGPGAALPGGAPRNQTVCSPRCTALLRELELLEEAHAPLPAFQLPAGWKVALALRGRNCVINVAPQRGKSGKLKWALVWGAPALATGFWGQEAPTLSEPLPQLLPVPAASPAASQHPCHRCAVSSCCCRHTATFAGRRRHIGLQLVPPHQQPLPPRPLVDQPPAAAQEKPCRWLPVPPAAGACLVSLAVQFYAKAHTTQRQGTALLCKGQASHLQHGSPQLQGSCSLPLNR